MALFGKKNEEDELNELDQDTDFSLRKFRDLKPENRKKRKEPDRPWGTRERLLVLIVLLGTVVTSGVLAASARGWKLPGLPRISLSKFTLPTIDFFEGETIVLEKGKVTKVDDENETAKKAIAGFSKLTKNLSGIYGLYVVRLKSGYSYGIFEKEKFEAASLIKLPVFAALYKEAEQGGINLDTKYALKEADKIGGSGSLAGKPAGTLLTYRDMARLMGKESDNTAFGILRRVLGDDKIVSVMKQIGMMDTSIAKNETTPFDVGLWFEKVYGGQIVSKEHANEILGYMTDTIYENWLAAGIPEEIRVAHKYGRELHVVNDAGIVFAQKPFIIVIMSKAVVEKEADQIFPTLATTIYNVETQPDGN